MKVAVCISGEVRSHAEKNIKDLKEKLPYDFFLSTWSYCDEGSMPVTKYPVPPLKYDPILDTLSPWMRMKHDYRNPTSHLQIVGHALQLMFDVPPEYDMIVRTRYDCILNDKVNFVKWVESSYNKKEIYGFRIYCEMTRQKYESNKRRFHHDKNKDEFVNIEPIGEFSPCFKGYPSVQDFMIMYPRECFDPVKVFDLYHNNKLHGREYGWAQMLLLNNDFKYGYVAFKNAVAKTMK